MRESNIPAFWGAFVGGAFIGGVWAAGLPGLPRSPLVIVAAVVVGGAVGKLFGWLVVDGAGHGMSSIYSPTSSGNYVPTHSHIDTLESKGDFAGAALAWEDIAAQAPADAWPLIRAGELLARKLGDAPSALERFKRARDRTNPQRLPELHRYTTQKVIDLYLGPLNDEGRAMVEMRRLIDEHPGTREAAFARDALQRIKAR